MAQISFRGITATAVAFGAAITTGNVQVLPSWAPPIEYIGSTTPWMVDLIMPTSVIGVGNSVKQAKVRAYGRKDNLYDGRDCIALSDGATGGDKTPLITVSYLAVGELCRPS